MRAVGGRWRRARAQWSLANCGEQNVWQSACAASPSTSDAHVLSASPTGASDGWLDRQKLQPLHRHHPQWSAANAAEHQP